jgi:hypothetical protein
LEYRPECLTVANPGIGLQKSRKKREKIIASKDLRELVPSPGKDNNYIILPNSILGRLS